MDGLASAIGEVLPAAVGVALSPLPIVAVLLLLMSGRLAAPAAFVVGWVGALELVASVVVLVLGDSATTDSGATNDGIGWGRSCSACCSSCWRSEAGVGGRTPARTRRRRGGWRPSTSSGW